MFVSVVIVVVASVTAVGAAGQYNEFLVVPAYATSFPDIRVQLAQLPQRRERCSD